MHVQIYRHVNCSVSVALSSIWNRRVKDRKNARNACNLTSQRCPGAAIRAHAALGYKFRPCPRTSTSFLIHTCSSSLVPSSKMNVLLMSLQTLLRSGCSRLACFRRRPLHCTSWKACGGSLPRGPARRNFCWHPHIHAFIRLFSAIERRPGEGTSYPYVLPTNRVDAALTPSLPAAASSRTHAPWG